MSPHSNARRIAVNDLTLAELCPQLFAPDAAFECLLMDLQVLDQIDASVVGAALMNRKNGRPLIAFGAFMGTAAITFKPGATDTSMEEMQMAVTILAAVCVGGALLCFVAWPRLCWTLLLYAVPARLTVLLFTWLAKDQGWDTHYTKFGEQGYEQDMTGTMIGASIAQLGIWVPLTIITGSLTGCLLFGRRKA